MTNLLLITGPAGAGKSTTAAEFLRQAKGTWAYINQDELRQLVKTGYSTADGYEKDWPKETVTQWEVSIPVCCDIAKRYIEHGINCLIDFNASPDEFKKWNEYLRDLDYKLVVLLPDETTVISRNKNRDSRSKLKDNKIIQNYKKLAAWENNEAIIINNTQGSPFDTVAKLNSLIE